MLSYSKQTIVCESIREMIRQALLKSRQLPTRLKAASVPSTDSILRAVSTSSNADTEESLKDFIVDYVLATLRFTEVQREDLNLNGQKPS